MKNLLNTLLALSLMMTIACKKDEETPTPEPETQAGVVELSGNLTTQTLSASTKYLLKGQVFIDNGVTLTIPAGTVIMGDKGTKATLVVKMGGKLNAVGTASNPIVFTSEQAVGERDKGDWGGIVLLGKANVNQASTTIEGISPAVSYGTYNSSTYNDDSSGVLQYVRIEFAGIALSPNNETNSLTMGAIGSKTVIDHIQASYGGDDGYEWFGGTVNVKNIISFGTWDDDFDCDFGYAGNVQYALAIRAHDAADQSGSNGFEVDNDGTGTSATPKTAPVFSNVTIIGPRADSAIGNSSINGNYQNAMHIRRNSAISIFNSIFTGFNTGLLLETSAYANYPATGVLSNNIIAFSKRLTANPTMFGAGDAGVPAYWNAGNKLDTISTNPSKNGDWAAVGLSESMFFAENTNYPADPSLVAVTATGTQMPTASFIDPKLSGSFFTNTAFVGAFGGTDWTDLWSNFDPKNKAY